MHSTARVCQSSVQAALHHLTSARGMARWNLGMFDTTQSPDGTLTGVSLFDGTRAYARADIDTAKGLVTYRIGANPATLVARIQAQVIDGPALGYAPGQIMVCLQTWRTKAMDDARWARLMATHETEIDLIQAQLERLPPADTVPPPSDSTQP